MKLTQIKNQEVKELLIENGYEENDEVEEKELLSAEYEVAFNNGDVENINHLEDEENCFTNTKAMYNIWEQNDEILKDFEDDTTDKFYSESLGCDVFRTYSHNEEEFCTDLDASCTICPEWLLNLGEKLKDEYSLTVEGLYSQWAGNRNFIITKDDDKDIKLYVHINDEERNIIKELEELNEE